MKTEFELDTQALREMGRETPDAAELAATRRAVMERIGARRFPGELRWAVALGAAALALLGWTFSAPIGQLDLTAVEARPAPAGAPELSLSAPVREVIEPRSGGSGEGRPHGQPAQNPSVLPLRERPAAHDTVAGLSDEPSRPEIEVVGLSPASPDQPESDILRVGSDNPNVVIYWLVEEQGDYL